MTIPCNTCAKLRRRNNRDECAALSGKLPVWGIDCSAYSDDTNWALKIQIAVKDYQLHAQKERRGAKIDH